MPALPMLLDYGGLALSVCKEGYPSASTHLPPLTRVPPAPPSWRKELTWRCFLVSAITIVMVRYLVSTCVSHGHCAYLQWGSLAWFQQAYPSPYGQVGGGPGGAGAELELCVGKAVWDGVAA